MTELLVHDQIPAEAEEMEALLRKAKLDPTPRAMPRKREETAPKERKKRPRFAKKITNEHMPHLFLGEAPAQIDTV